MPGDRPPWVPEIEGSIGLMFNTCDDLDGQFIKYMEDQIGLPAWGVGPLLPEMYWQPSHSLIHDQEIREPKRQSNLTEGEVIQWLETKPRGSVLYVAFGSEVGPTMEEYQQLANGLGDSTRPFICVIQPGKGSCGLDKKVGDRGYMVSDDLSETVKEDDIVKGIEMLMGDEEMHNRAILIKAKLRDDGFPASSEAGLDAFRGFILNQKAIN
ncbi:hypothetical protein GH714_043473 [Hevea brasiliensis]|uniref:Uncharacterized protein n=1 Tax=Hevea brasiliensis TaxID=3981 RepID=A0A6A6K4D0_HEVBR|nr:hypothetical protein GH714_043473 [Hevea brasiliensis]